MIGTIPNMLTASRLLILPGVIVLSRNNRPVAALALFLVMMATDVLDGYLARLLKQESRLGLYLDPVVDKIVSLTLLYELGLSGLLPLVIPHLFLARELLANGIRAWAGTLGTVVTANWMGKTKLFLQTILIGWGLAMPLLSGSAALPQLLCALQMMAALVLMLAWGFLVMFFARNRELFTGK